MKRKICVITGSRADYGILSPVIRAINSSKNFKLHLIATSMHLMGEFGYTLKEIENDKLFVYTKVDVSHKEDTGEAITTSLGKSIIGIAKIYSKINPAFVIVMGDRWEMLAAAVAANYMNIAIAHIHGGEVSGHVDGITRHAITKLSHIHFVATKESRERILKMGEEPQRIFLVGAPALDRIFNEDLISKKELVEKYKLDSSNPLLLVVQHPVAMQENDAAKHIKITMEAVSELKLQTIIIYPNSDAGGRRIIRVIRTYERSPFIKSFKSVPHKDYLGLMKISSVLIGNSSSGIIEAPSFKLPVVNIGTRQFNRERSSNVIDAKHNKKSILMAINKALYDKEFINQVKSGKNPFGDGKASLRIVKVLRTIELGKRLLAKKIIY